MSITRRIAPLNLIPLVVVGLLSACSSPAEEPGAGPTQQPSSDAALADLYGFAPRPDPSITYQPDVIIVEGGPKVIRAVSADGLTWSVDASAPGVDRLEQGAIMFLTSQAVGRIVRLSSRAGVVDVTLAPVDLGDVIRDGRLVVDQAVPLDSLTFFEAPQIPGGHEDAASDELVRGVSYGGDRPAMIFSPAIAPLSGPRRMAYVEGNALATEPSDVSQKSTTVEGWTLTAYKTSATAGLLIERGIAGSKTVGAGKTIPDADLKVAIDAHLEIPSLRVVADIPVSRGEVGSSHFRVYGIEGLVMRIQAGSVNGLSDNRKVRIEIPVQLRQNVIIGGFPAVLTQKFRFLVQTAFTAKNGNITGSAEWDVDGSIGMDGTTVTLPKVTARGQKLIDSIMGVSVGVNGIVVAVSFEFGLVFGLPVAGAGPAVSFVTSLGMTNGSSLGIVQCKQVSITSNVNAGVSIQVFDPIKQALKKILGVEIPAERPMLQQTVLQEKWVKPNVVACR